MSRLHAAFNRGLLKQIHAEVKERFPAVDLRKALSVTRSGRTWIVEGAAAGKRVFWAGRAEDAYHAKYKAWSNFLFLERMQ